MKFPKILLALPLMLSINAAHAEEEFLIAMAQVTHANNPAYIKLPACIDAQEIKIAAQKDKVEIEKAEVIFQSAKDKHVIFLTTLEPFEGTRWRSLGHYSDKVCINSIRIHGYAKHANKANIKILGKKD